RVRSTLFELGFTESDLDLPTSVLSGGQKKLIEFAKLVITQPDLLLLDEPDNHLDLTGKSNLEKYIRAFKGGVVIVSHDRYLLDLLADEIAELEDGRLTIFPGNYSEYAFEKQARLALQQQRYQDQQKEITRLENSAKRLLLWGHVHDNEKFIKRGKNILKRVERIDKIERPVLERKKMGLELSGWRGSNKVLELENLCKSFDGSADTPPLIKNANMLLWHGERVGLVGPNGAGKSVLFRMILDHFSPDTGEIKIGPSIKLGYYAQEHDTLEFDRTLLETVRRAAPLSENAAVSFLGRFLFSYRKVRENIENLSGGEKSRLQIALLMLTGANFLLLDEPTNNLDIQSAEVLEEAISEFEGSVFVISHDRYFLDQVVDRIVELDQGTLTEYQGGYGEYMAAKA
ncbi:MAG: ATP-binding cassette domain-containing protein, partial [Candidatus Heimdallarchaeota archaeon]|nr:ATP-binding cassette domain-containing protein [Candidatus Heimdallarchaeota archaeon]